MASGAKAGGVGGDEGEARKGGSEDAAFDVDHGIADAISNVSGRVLGKDGDTSIASLLAGRVPVAPMIAKEGEAREEVRDALKVLNAATDFGEAKDGRLVIGEEVEEGVLLDGGADAVEVPVVDGDVVGGL